LLEVSVSSLAFHFLFVNSTSIWRHLPEFIIVKQRTNK
jgi:hypothetical protein